MLLWKRSSFGWKPSVQTWVQFSAFLQQCQLSMVETIHPVPFKTSQFRAHFSLAFPPPSSPPPKTQTLIWLFFLKLSLPFVRGWVGDCDPRWPSKGSSPEASLYLSHHCRACPLLGPGVRFASAGSTGSEPCLPCCSRLAETRAHLLLRQCAAGSLGRRPVPLLPAIAHAVHLLCSSASHPEALHCVQPRHCRSSAQVKRTWSCYHSSRSSRGKCSIVLAWEHSSYSISWFYCNIASNLVSVLSHSPSVGHWRTGTGLWSKVSLDTLVLSLGCLCFQVEATPLLQCHREATVPVPWQGAYKGVGDKGVGHRGTARPCCCAGNMPPQLPRYNLSFWLNLIVNINFSTLT